MRTGVSARARLLCGLLFMLIPLLQPALAGRSGGLGSRFAGTANVAAQSAGFRVQGSSIIGPNGQPFVPRGIAVLGSQSAWRRVPEQPSLEAEADMIKNLWRFNAVRGNEYLPGYPPEFPFYTDSGPLDRQVQVYTSRQLVFMMQQSSVGGGGWGPSGPTDDQSRTWLSWWQDKAARYKDNPYVWFNLYNEPWEGTSTTPPNSWLWRAQAAIKAIRAAGANNIIVVQGNWAAADNKDYSGNLVLESESAILSFGPQIISTYSNILFDIHGYNQFGRYINGAPPTADQLARFENKLNDFVTRIHAKGMAVICGEFGVSNAGENTSPAVEVIFRVLPKKNVGWFGFHWSPGDGNTLTTEAKPGAGWKIDRTDGSRPTNLTFQGGKIWDATHAVPPVATPTPTRVPPTATSVPPTPTRVPPTSTPTPPPPTATAAPGSGLISGLTVYDSANAASWSIQPNLQAGLTAYGDRSFMIASVPSAVAGAAWVRPANSSKSSTNNPLAQITLAGPADVYLALDERVATPTWLSTWTSTADTILVNDTTTSPATARPMRLYRKAFPVGPVAFGPQPITESLMYLVAAVNTTIAINFQPAGAATPAGYLADTGAVFASRGNGQSYGWNTDVSSTMRDRNAANAPDQRYDTFAHMQFNGSSWTSNYSWEIALANGTYAVRIVAGDALNTDSTFKINAEGVLTVSGVPSSGQNWLEGTQTVTVSDGRLTIGNASGSYNNKINFIEITRR